MAVRVLQNTQCKTSELSTLLFCQHVAEGMTITKLPRNLEKESMKKLTLGFLALAMALAITPAALADQIHGTLGVGGGNDQWSATGITFTNTAAIARDATGAFGTLLASHRLQTPR